MSLTFIKENEWDNENIESRITNEAYVLGIQNFNFVRCNDDTNFTGNLRLIDAVKIVYELEDSRFNMFKECKAVLNLSKNRDINMSFVINCEPDSYIIPDIQINRKLTEEEDKHLDVFKDHIVLMLSIWKGAMIKRWDEYHQNDQ